MKLALGVGSGAGVTRTEVPFGAQADGEPFAVPVTVVRGTKDGPTLWVDAAIHGDEMVGVAAGWRMVEAVRPQRLQGTLVFASVTNPSAFHGLWRTSPIDHVDMNRVFPGDPGGSHTLQLADAYMRLVRTHATHYVNLHCGRTTSNVVFYSLYREGTSPAADVSRRMARAVGSGITWRSGDAWLDHSLFSLLQWDGVPGAIIEAGGEARAREEYVEPVAQGLLGIMRRIGMLQGAVEERPLETDVTSADFFHATRGGIWVARRGPGDRLKQGDVVGEIRDVYGDVLETVRCDAKEGIVLSLRTYAATPQGSSLGIIGRVNQGGD